MKQQSNRKQSNRQRESLEILEDRMQLLETIQEMIDIEFERRENIQTGGHSESDTPCSSPDPPPKDTLWKRICSLSFSNLFEANHSILQTPEPPTRRCSERSLNREAQIKQ